jgi:cyanophycin synthetase
MGRPGDLLLIFADALVRSWKQITKFKPAGAPSAAPSPTPPRPAGLTDSGDGAQRTAEPPPPTFSLEGLIRDERGVHFAPEAAD